MLYSFGSRNCLWYIIFGWINCNWWCLGASLVENYTRGCNSNECNNLLALFLDFIELLFRLEVWVINYPFSL